MEKICSPCGILCSDCSWFLGEKKPKCKGCIEIKGKAFWGEDVCDTYSCTEKRGVKHCGQCVDFPCEDFMERYDPDEGKISAVLRAGLLAYRHKHGDEKTVILTRNIR